MKKAQHKHGAMLTPQHKQGLHPVFHYQTGHQTLSSELMPKAACKQTLAMRCYYCHPHKARTAGQTISLESRLHMVAPHSCAPWVQGMPPATFP